MTQNEWLPISKKETLARGWNDLDVILISGDAYVDHPSFGSAVIARTLESLGLKVAIVPQPNWKDDLRDFKKLGKPNLFFGVTAGCMDSMVNHYTANRRKRSNDAYTPGGESGFRPDYAVKTYTQILKKLFPEIPVIIGGIEASLRRVTHYDYWSDQLKTSILEESGADLLAYGMGEQALKQVVRLLSKGVPFENLNTIPQTAILRNQSDIPVNKKWEDVELVSHEKCLSDKLAFASNFKIVETESNKVKARRILQKVKNQVLIVNPPFPTMNEKEIDASFDLPYTRMPHPRYAKRGPIPAYEMIRHSINLHRGCFGGCSFCTISAHQGKFIASRSENSILKEVNQVVAMPDFKGYISDLGGPSANMYKMKGVDLKKCEECVRPSCIYPAVCSNLNTSHAALNSIYKKVQQNPEVKKATVGSGIRYDLLTPSYNRNVGKSEIVYLENVVKNHLSGRLKVAPEHSSESTLKLMRKPSFKHFKEFQKLYERANQKANLKQPLIPYFISSHPGCSEEDMAELAAETKEMGFHLEQVQDFTPTPMTVATVIYYSGYHPYTLKKAYVAKSKETKINQHRFFFWYKKENRAWIKSKLLQMKRNDLLKRFLN